jgi:cytochrome c556
MPARKGFGYSSPMRSLILLVLGLAVGALAASSVINALGRRDAYPRGLMNVMQHHAAALHEAVRGGRCDGATAHIAALSTLSRDIDSAMYPDSSPEESFLEYEHRLGDALTVAANAGTDCKAIAPAVERIAAACDSCHHQYR